jgi:UDP-3-O-acyl-N-acetylglucosamine deacetylase
MRAHESFTISRSVGPFTGVGLFTGKPATLRFVPGDVGSGLRVRRLSFDQAWTQAVDVKHVVDDHTSWAGLMGVLVRNTTLRVSAQPSHTTASDTTGALATVEHALAALAGLHITDVTIEVEGVECPILDGSCLAFASALFDARINAQASLPVITLDRDVRIEDAKTGASIVAVPVASLEDAACTYNLDYGDRGGIGRQSATWLGDASAFVRDVAPARTFALESELAQARAAGQFSWLSPKDIPVFRDAPGASGLIDNQLRFDDEPARHKLLDLIGDLALLGGMLQASVIATKGGHALTHALCREVLRHAR